jgi:hypothetical protein
MNVEQQLLKSFYASDGRGRLAILEYAASMAEDWPDLGLGLGQIIADPACLPGSELDNLEPPPIVGPSK